MKMTLIAVMLGLFTLSWPGQAEELSKIKEDMEQVQTLREEITLLNLLNGLNLTDEQSRNILNLAREARAIREGSLMENAALLAEFKEALLNLKEGLADKNWRPDPETEKKAGQLNHRLKEIKEKTSVKLQALGEEAKGVLTPGQLGIVADFKPCLIPPKDLKSPTRAGQAFDAAPIERFLTRVRYIPVERYAIVSETLVEEFLNRLEKRLGPIPDKEAKKEKILEVMEKARAMTDEEFALEKEDLASSLAPGIERRGSIFKIHRMDKVSRFLLDEKIIPILEKRLALSGDFTPGTGTALDSIPTAPDTACPSGEPEKR